MFLVFRTSQYMQGSKRSAVAKRCKKIIGIWNEVHRKICKSGTKNLNITFIESMTFLKKYVQFSVDIPI